MPVKPLGQRSPLKMRYGANVPMALGMHRRGGASRIPDAAFYHLENVLFAGPNVKSRPGQQKATDQVTGPIEGIHEASDIGAPGTELDEITEANVYFMTKNSSTEQIYINELNTETLVRTQHPVGLSPGFYRMGDVVSGDGASDGFVLASDGHFYIACRKVPGDGTCTPVLLKVDSSTWVVTEVFADPLGAVTNNGPHFWDLVEDPANPLVFYITKQIDASGGNRVYHYTGGVGTLDDGSLTFGDACLYGSLSFLGSTPISAWALTGNPFVGDTAVPIRRRTGVATWTTVTPPTPPAGTPPNGYIGAGGGGDVLGGVLYLPVLYGGFGGPHLWQILSVTSGWATAVAHDITPGATIMDALVALGSGTFRAKTVGGVLYYTYINEDGELVLGSFDGSDWTDEVHNFGVSGNATWFSVVGGATFLMFHVTGSAQKLARSASPTSSWTDIYTIPAGEAIVATKIFGVGL